MAVGYWNEQKEQGVFLIVSRSRLFRVAAFCDLAIALIVGALSSIELYIIRTGQFQNSNWLDPNAWARTQAWGLLLCLLCVGAGYGLWKSQRWARWFELLLIPPKLYCAYIELWIYKMSGSFITLLLILLILGSIATTFLLWLPIRPAQSNGSTST
ncbi:MAG: hypothetical protein ACM3WP_19320 [Acidobacteriota bacterium]